MRGGGGESHIPSGSFSEGFFFSESRKLLACAVSAVNKDRMSGPREVATDEADYTSETAHKATQKRGAV